MKKDEIEKDFYRAIIYYALALGEYEKKILSLLNYDEKPLIEVIMFECMPKEHPAVKYYEKVNHLIDAEFLTFAKLKVLNFFDKVPYEYLSSIKKEEEVDIVVQAIMSNKIEDFRLIAEKEFDMAIKYTEEENWEKNVENIEKIIFWLEKSANLDNQKAQYCLGYLHYNCPEELGMKPNKEYGIKLLIKARNNGNEDAIIELEKIKNDLHISESNIADEDIIEKLKNNTVDDNEWDNKIYEKRGK